MNHMLQVSLSFAEVSFLRLVLLSSMREYSHAIDLDNSLLATAPPDMVETYTKLLKSDLNDHDQAEKLYKRLLDLL